MAWYPEWKALAAQITGLVEAGRFCIQCFPTGATAAFGVINQEIIPQSQEIFERLRAFSARHKDSLPIGGVEVLDRFTQRLGTFFNPKAVNGMGNDKILNLMQHRLTALAAFVAEFTYHLTDRSAAARRLSDRAFAHLKRSLVADRCLRELWLEAFEAGEPECEKLGAIHLLLHGIWAFKVIGQGERTDLVMVDLTKGDPLDLGEAERSAEALVLTEWKRVTEKDNPETKAQEAFRQASLYSEGILASLVLERYRYLVLVSQSSCPLPSDFENEGIRYEHINIVVEPEPPSRVARRSKKRITPGLQRTETA